MEYSLQSDPTGFDFHKSVQSCGFTLFASLGTTSDDLLRISRHTLALLVADRRSPVGPADAILFCM